MRPPEFTGGNQRCRARLREGENEASMRPPEFTGGNGLEPGWTPLGGVELQ